MLKHYYGLFYIKFFFFIFCIDGLLFDDEPIWEPIEWSLVQTWILFLFIFAWISEVLFSSKFGSYTNRDKIVWLGLHKTYFIFQFWFLINIFIVTIFVTLPFYYEITYLASYIVLWWNWLNAVFFFKLSSIFSFIILLVLIIKSQLRWLQPRTVILLFLLIVVLIAYLLYFNFITTFFAFFTDLTTFSQSGWMETSNLIHGPLKWSYGSETRDHFSYHSTTTSFWFKNDPLIASSFLFLNVFLFFYMLFILIQTFVFIRMIYISHLISYNNLTFYLATIKQFFYLLLFLIFLVFMSFVYQLIRFPFELYWFNKVLFYGYSFTKVLHDFFFDLTYFVEFVLDYLLFFF